MYLVGQTVEPVSLHARTADVERQWNQIGNRLVAAVKGGVKAGDLRHGRQPLGDRVHGRQVVWLMERSQRLEGPQFLHHHRSDDSGRRIPRTAVDDAMADAEDMCPVEAVAKPRGENVERGPRVAHRIAEVRVVERAALTVPGDEPRGRANALNLPRRRQAPGLVGGLIEAELQARGARVEYQNEAVDRHRITRRARRAVPVAVRGRHASRRRSWQSAHARCPRGS